MLLSLLLTVFAAPQTAPTQTSAVDYFPADTLAVADFSLGPWDRTRKQTIAHPILKELRILRTFSDQIQLELEEVEALDEKFDLRKLFAESRIWVGLPATTLPAGHLLIGVDALKVSMSGDFGVVFDRLKVPYTRVGTSILAIAYLDGGTKMDAEDAQLILKQYIEAAAPKGADAAIPYTLSNQKSWQALHAGLASKDRVFGFWVPSEPWRDGHWRKLVQRFAGDSPDTEMGMKAIERMLAGIGMNQIEGYAMVSEVAVPFLQDRALVLGAGPLMDIYQPYSTDPAAAWQRLAECDGASISSAVGGMDIAGFANTMISVVSEIVGDMVGVDIMEDPEARPFIDAILNFVVTMGPGFVTEASADHMDLTGSTQMTITINDMEKAKRAIAEMPPQIVAGFQMGMAQAGTAFSVEWGEDCLVLMKDPNLNGESTLADTASFQQALPIMKEFAGNRPPVWLTYTSPAYDAYFLSTMGETVDFFADLFDLGVLVDFSKLGNVSDLEPRMHPGFAVMTRQPGKLELRSRSAFGFILPAIGLAARAVQQELANGSFELEEDEF